MKGTMGEGRWRAALWIGAFGLLTGCGPKIDAGTPEIKDHSDRVAVLAAYQPALQLQGEAQHGMAIYEDTCRKCHEPRKDGIRVGPDLRTIRRRAPGEVLESIMNPSARIDAKHVNYIARMKDGRVQDGLLAAADEQSITLRDGEADHRLLRAEIDRIGKSKVSLMPEEIEKGLSRQSIADLIAYVLSLKP
jgi:putative heme-binding domain-containing protein